jgi:lipoprotein-anchoring transpeptidase ErfK/SrfK
MARPDRALARPLTLVVAFLAVAAVVAAIVIGTGSAHGVPTGRAVPAPHSDLAVPTSAAPVSTLPSGPPPALIATIAGPIPYHSTPAGPLAGTISATNPFGVPMVLAVIGRQDDGAASWLHVELPVRPNGTTGWIPASAASLTETSYAVSVSLAARTLTVTYAGQAVLTTSVAGGKPKTPTPPAHTYLWELIQPDDQKGPYGPYIFGLAEFSDAYSVFNGGDAQIGIHGQDEPWSIGQAASNGCIRLPNDVISRLAGLLPLGTPVTIA